MTMRKAPCQHCGETLIHVEGRGYVHDEGGSVMQSCDDVSCEWEGAPWPSAVECPDCGSSEHLRNDHTATPVMGEAVGPV
jgi:predicted RNA-binding Zn-ribbon protein involved in translation (DUF1610 family)